MLNFLNRSVPRIWFQVSAQPPVKKTAGQIVIGTFGARFQNLPLLGFALSIRTGKM
jgi:hypothetical protein